MCPSLESWEVWEASQQAKVQIGVTHSDFQPLCVQSLSLGSGGGGVQRQKLEVKQTQIEAALFSYRGMRRRAPVRRIDLKFRELAFISLTRLILYLSAMPIRVSPFRTM